MIEYRQLAKKLITYTNPYRHGIQLNGHIVSSKEGGDKIRSISVAGIHRDWYFGGNPWENEVEFNNKCLQSDDKYIKKTRYRPDLRQYISSGLNNKAIIFIDIDAHSGETDALDYYQHIITILRPIKDSIYGCSSKRGYHIYVFIDNHLPGLKSYINEVIEKMKNRLPGPYESKLEFKCFSVFRCPTVSCEEEVIDLNNALDNPIKLKDLTTFIDSLPKAKISEVEARPKIIIKSYNRKIRNNDLKNPDAFIRNMAAAKEYDASGSNEDFIDFYEAHAAVTGPRTNERINRCNRCLNYIRNHKGSYNSDPTISGQVRKNVDRVDIIKIKETAKKYQINPEKLKDWMSIWVEFIIKDSKRGRETAQKSLTILGCPQRIVSALHWLFVSAGVVEIIADYSWTNHKARTLRLILIKTLNKDCPKIPTPHTRCCYTDQAAKTFTRYYNEECEIIEEPPKPPPRHSSRYIKHYKEVLKTRNHCLGII